MTPNESDAEQQRLRAAAKAKSPIVTRRRALTMAFHEAVAAIAGAKNKTSSSILDAAAGLRKSSKNGHPPGR